MSDARYSGPLDLPSVMGQRSPLEGGVALPSPDRGFLPAADYVGGQGPGIAELRQQYGHLVHEMHEKNRRPDPLDVMMEFGGGPGTGSALAMSTAPARSALKKLTSEQAARALKGEGGRGIASVNLRGMTQENAIAQARTEQHLIGSNVREGFVGGPAAIKNRGDLERARAAYDRDVEEGVGGAHWYDQARAGTAEMAGPNPAKQTMLANEKALWSARADPSTNLGFTLQGHNAYEAGTPAELVFTRAQAERYNKARAEGREIPLGDKTATYAGGVNPSVAEPVTGVHDIWDARGWGYSEQEIKNGLHPHQHAFLDAEGLLAVDRANKKKLGGRSDWTAGQVQAAAWVTGKGRGLAEEKFKVPWQSMTPEQKQWGLGEASKSYPEFFEKYTANATYEATPYAHSGHLPELVKAPYAEKKAFMDDPKRSWTDEHGRDVLYDAAGMYQRPGREATGIYTPPGGTQEINPARVARPMVGMAGETGDRTMDPASRALMQGVEGTRAYMDVQGAGAGHKVIGQQKVGSSQSLFVPHESPLSLQQIEAYQTGGGKVGVPDVIDTGKGAVLTSFAEKGPLGKDVASALRKGQAPAGAEQIKIDPLYVPMYEKGTREGSGEVTRQLQEVLANPQAPALLAKLDASPAVRQAALNRFQQNAEYAERTGQVAREDVQRALDLIGREGFSGLLAALQKGVALPAALTALLLPALQGRDE